MTKICKTCKIEKDEESFKINPLHGKRHWRCFDCQEIAANLRKENANKRNKIRYVEKKDVIREYHKQRYINNKAEIDAKQKIYSDNNKDKAHERYLKRSEGRISFRLGVCGPINHRVCAHCEENKHLLEFGKSKHCSFGFQHICKECMSIKRKKEYPKYKAMFNRSSRKWRENNPEKNLECQRKHRQSEKYKNNRAKTQVRIIKNVSSYLRGLLKERGLKRRTGKGKYIDCEPQLFFDFLESQFIDGMTWENYGKGKDKWVLDHYIPCEAFNLENDKELAICCNWKNFRPLWWNKNSEKQDKMPNGSLARDSKNNYTLQDKINMIEERFLSLNYIIEPQFSDTVTGSATIAPQSSLESTESAILPQSSIVL